MPTAAIHKGTKPILGIAGTDQLEITTLKGEEISASNIWYPQSFDYEPQAKLKEIPGQSGPRCITAHDYRERLSVDAIAQLVESEGNTVLGTIIQIPSPGDTCTATFENTQITGAGWEVVSANLVATFDEYVRARFEFERKDTVLTTP